MSELAGDQKIKNEVCPVREIAKMRWRRRRESKSPGAAGECIPFFSIPDVVQALAELGKQLPRNSRKVFTNVID